MTFDVQIATPADYDAIGEVMFRAVHEGESPYTAAEREVWMPTPRTGEDWHKRLSEQHVLKATSDTGELIGFMSLCDNGYVDFAYILLEARGQGLFRKLYDDIARFK
jgi:putative acetyltransferase